MSTGTVSHHAALLAQCWPGQHTTVITTSVAETPTHSSIHFTIFLAYISLPFEGIEPKIWWNLIIEDLKGHNNEIFRPFSVFCDWRFQGHTAAVHYPPWCAGTHKKLEIYCPPNNVVFYPELPWKCWQRLTSDEKTCFKSATSWLKNWVVKMHHQFHKMFQTWILKCEPVVKTKKL